jgi:hypothetical protein
MSNKVAGVVAKLVDALEGLDSADERRRATQAALTVFGDSSTAEAAPRMPLHPEEDFSGIHSAGLAWMKRCDLALHDIQHVIHIDGSSASLLTSVGASKREQTKNTYLLTGVLQLLSTGKAEFTDEMARGNCESLGCYDVNNHGSAVKDLGNKSTGSRAGFKTCLQGFQAGRRRMVVFYNRLSTMTMQAA